ncbi:alpha-L-arabinofuranosidase C-terminal domain-containing protein [Paenibacillus thalictri]|uniref:non-reducing end alpha-L-arabinofuranosidase n=1 Tax=Paenibacillus thalictri TaxID=2527873 RepID=A0A4Q9DF13_9BACL|nr:alpha-L-arabinofuranosidase C-terminal domain-containing protein [Paenibacillus thalictri]TBL70393.1 alpha-N-arabinofuranosidase [Paenibacillus thalictri]
MKAHLKICPEERLGEVNPYIYGQYFEHLGNCIYPSVWDDQSPQADDIGNRLDVIQAVKELGVPVVRWPGGCYVDLYDWRDGVGPRETRPTRVNWHWGGLESNKFGTDEFLQWCEKAGTEPYVNVNLGTGTLVESLRWIDYCNGAGETADAQWRQANGRAEPYNVKLWGIGNETWGDWEAGRLNARDYAHKLANWAQFYKKYDSSLRLLGVGSHHGSDADWDQEVIAVAGKYLDYLTFHLYGSSVDRESGDEYYPVVFTPVYFEKQLRKMAETIKIATVQNKLQVDRPIQISMDEWNIRHYEPDPEKTGSYRLNRNSPRNLQDALFAAGIFNAMIRLGDSVGMANYVFLVNGNGVISVDGDMVIKTTLFHVFQQYAAWMTGQSVGVRIDAPAMIIPPPQINNPGMNETAAALHEPTAETFVDASAVIRENGELNIAVVNRHKEDEAELELELPAGYRLTGVWTLAHDRIYAANTPDAPERLLPVSTAVEEADVRKWVVPAHAVTLLQCRKM